MKSEPHLRAAIKDLKHRESLLVGGGDDHTRQARKKWLAIYGSERELLEWLVGERRFPTVRAVLFVLRKGRP